LQHFRVDEIDGFTRTVSYNLVKDVGELNLIFLAGDVPDMGRADHILQRQQGMIRARDWFLFVNPNHYP
jgi:hypothetical protein